MEVRERGYCRKRGKGVRCAKEMIPLADKKVEDLKPKEAELNDKEVRATVACQFAIGVGYRNLPEKTETEGRLLQKQIAKGGTRNKTDYPTMKDVASDWDSDKVRGTVTERREAGLR